MGFLRIIRLRQQRSLRKRQLRKLIDKADNYIYEKNLFLNQNLKLKELSAILGTNRTYLSRAIAMHKQCSYYDYLNIFRVIHFTEIAHNEENKHLSLIELSEKCGFRKVTTLNDYFKYSYGITATKFMNMKRN